MRGIEGLRMSFGAAQKDPLYQSALLPLVPLPFPYCFHSTVIPNLPVTERLYPSGILEKIIQNAYRNNHNIGSPKGNNPNEAQVARDYLTSVNKST